MQPLLPDAVGQLDDGDYLERQCQPALHRIRRRVVAADFRGLPQVYPQDGTLLDEVKYENGENNWPESNNRGSIFLACDRITTIDNDDGSHWELSIAGANEVYATPEEAGPPADSDEGSPAWLPTSTLVLSPPTAEDDETLISQDSSTVAIPLVAQDPESDPMDVYIESLVNGLSPTSGSGGTLSDPGGGTIDSAPYRLLNGGNQVEFTPAAGVSGLFAFGFRAHDGTAYSNYAYVIIALEATGSVVIAEIMYNPANNNGYNSDEDDWEWIEIHNPTASTVSLGTLWDNNQRSTGNLIGKSIPAGETRVVTRTASTEAGARTLTDFVTEWSPLTAGDVIEVDRDDMPYLNNNGGDTLSLFASDGSLLDVVDYDNGSGWPNDDGMSSIYVTIGHLSSSDNNEGTNWALSVDGSEGAYATPEDPGEPFDSDVGSPAILPQGTPIAEDGEVSCNQDTSPGILIDLIATDDITPPESLIYMIVSGPTGVSPTTGSGGTLTDPNNGEADVTSGGTLASNQVRFTPAAGVSGLFAFTWQANDGSNDGNIATITCWVQGTGRVVISEIMYDPDNEDTEWEWVEIHNQTDSAVDLHTLYDSKIDSANFGNLVGKTLPADDTMIIAKEDIDGGRSLAEFLTEWSPLPGGDVLAIDPGTFAGLNNTGGDTLKLLSADGDLLDVVTYEDGENGWPTSNNESSIYVTGGNVSTFANDDSSNWARSINNVDNAWRSYEGVGSSESDVGSPGMMPPELVPPEVDTAVSYKTHGGAGEFGVNVLDRTDGADIESRTGGTTKLVIGFDKDIQRLNGDLTDVELSSSGGAGPPYRPDTITLSAPDVLTIEMSGTTDAGPLTVTFPGIADASDASAVCDDDVCIRQLVGDVRSDEVVNLFDLIDIRNQMDETTTADIAKCDVRFDDGVINLFDMIDVRNNMDANFGGTCD